MAELTFQASDRDGTTLVLVDGSVDTGYRMLGPMAIGDPTFTPEFAGARGTHGARPTGASAENRSCVVRLRCQGATKDGLAARESALALVMDRIRRFGGKVSWRSNGQTYRQHGIAFTGSMAMEPWDKRAENSYLREATCTFICAPFLDGDPCDITDTFDADTLANYTSDGAIAKADLIVAGGVVAVDTTGNPANELRLIHTDRGYSWNYFRAIVQARTPSGTLTGWKLGVILSRVDASNYVEAYVDDNGTNSRLRMDTVIAGVRANVVTKNLAARIAASTPYALRVTSIADLPPSATVTVLIEYFAGSNDIERFAVSTDSHGGATPLILSEAGFSHIALKDVGDVGYGGVTRFAVEPLIGNGQLRYEFDEIPGDAPAKCDLIMEPGAGAEYRWIAFGWNRPANWNLCLNPVFTTDASGWDINGVTGLCVTPTSAVVTTGVAFIGDKCLRVTPSGVADSGVAYPIYNGIGSVKTNRLYTLKARVRSTSSTATVEAAFGASGADIGTVGSVTLSPEWKEVTATATLGAVPGYAVIRIPGTSTVAFDIDAVSVYATEDGEPPLHTFPTGPIPPFGWFAPANCEAGGGAWNLGGGSSGGGNWTSDTSIAAGGETETLSFWVGPHLTEADDYADGEALLEVWANLTVHADFGVMTARLAGGDLADQYALEYGSAGFVIPPPVGATALPVRFGTLAIPAGSGRGVQAYKITLSVQIAADTNAQPFTWSHLLLLNPRKRVTTPTGKAQADIPLWRPVPASGNTVEIIHSDLSRSIRGVLQNGPGPGVGGESLIELDPGKMSTILIVSNVVPNDPGGLTGNIFGGPGYRLSLTPRWHWLRDE